MMLYPHEPNTIILYFYIYDFNILNHLTMFYSKHVCIPACTFCIKSKTIRVERYSNRSSRKVSDYLA